jgi:hypothetical protein
MRLLPSTTVAAMVAAAALSGFAACNHQSFSDYPSEGSDASTRETGSASSSGGFAGDDSSSSGSDVFVIGDGNVGPPSDCAIPSGTYEVTATPAADSGAACTAMTTTEVFPPPKTNDAGLLCTYDPTGMLPVCGVSFDCTSIVPGEAGTIQTAILGNIQVAGTSLAGAETIDVTLGPSGNTTSCSYTLSFVKK